MEQQEITGTLISFKDFPNRNFILVPPSGHKNMEIFTKITGVLSPVLGAGLQSGVPFFNKAKEYEESLESEDSDYVERPDFDVFPVAAVLGEAINSEEVRSVARELLDGLYHAVPVGDSGKATVKVDLDKELGGADFVLYMKLLEYAIEQSIKIPLVYWLESNGLSGIGSALQSAMESVLMSTEDK